MKTLLLTLALAVPLLASEMTPPTASGGLSYEAAGAIIASAIAAFIGYTGGSKARALRVQGEFRKLSEYVTREEFENLRSEMNRLAGEIGGLKGYTSEIKGKLEIIADCQQKILNRLMGAVS